MIEQATENLFNMLLHIEFVLSEHAYITSWHDSIFIIILRHMIDLLLFGSLGVYCWGILEILF